MRKEDYLSASYQWLTEIVNDRSFRMACEGCFGSDPEYARARVGYIVSEGSLLLREGFGDKDFILCAMRDAARVFNNLAEIAVGGEREFLLLNSALCYHIVGAWESAHDIANRIDTFELGQETPDIVLMGLFLDSLVSFLKQDIIRLRQITAQALCAIRELQGPLIKGIISEELSLTESYGLVAHTYFHRALSCFARYCLDKDLKNLRSACQSLEKCHDYFLRGREATLEAIISGLRTSLGLFYEREATFNAMTNGDENGKGEEN